MQDFRNLAVWQRARRLTKSVYVMMADFPGSEEFGLKSQMRRATVSICSNIAEGCGRRGDREFRRFLDIAMGSAGELECEAILSSTWRSSPRQHRNNCWKNSSKSSGCLAASWRVLAGDEFPTG